MGMMDDLDMFTDPSGEDSGEREEGFFQGCKVLKASAKAILVKFPNRNQPHWVPKTQLEGGECCEVGDVGELRITSWLVSRWEEEGFNPDEEEVEDPKDTTEIQDAVCMRETDAALMVRIGKQDIWFPKTHIKKTSQIQGDGDCGVLAVSTWIAKEKKLLSTTPIGPSESKKDDDTIPF